MRKVGLLQEPEWAEESGQEGYIQLEVDDKGWAFQSNASPC